jgi:hypothetical protein
MARSGRHVLTAIVLAWLLLASAVPAFACQAPSRPTAEIAREVDRIVLGTVASRTGHNPWAYEVDVERVLKGPHPVKRGGSRRARATAGCPGSMSASAS